MSLIIMKITMWNKRSYLDNEEIENMNDPEGAEYENMEQDNDVVENII